MDLTELFSRWLTPRFDIDWIMARDDGGGAGALCAAPGERFLLSARPAAAWLAHQLRLAVRIARSRSASPGLVQVRDAALSAALFMLAARLAGRPFVYWMSFPMAEDYSHRARHPAATDGPVLRLARRGYGALAGFVLYRLVLPRADHVFVQSEQMKADVAGRGVAPGRITAVPMGVSTGVYRPETISPASDPRLRGRVLVYLGAIGPDRRIERLVHALALVAAAGVEAVLVIVGEAQGAERRRLTAAARQDGVEDRLVVTGRLPLAEALAYVRRADVCLAPFPTWPAHYLSATPTKLVEYLAMGRPVAASDHPDQRRVIKDSGAGVVAPFTAEGFAMAILDLLADRPAAEAMGARGPAWVAAHRDYEAIAATVAAVYDRLLGFEP